MGDLTNVSSSAIFAFSKKTVDLTYSAFADEYASCASSKVLSEILPSLCSAFERTN